MSLVRGVGGGGGENTATFATTTYIWYMNIATD